MTTRHIPARLTTMLRLFATVTLTLTALLTALLTAPLGAGAADEQRYFPETQHTVSGRFLDYWEAHGGVEQQGYPLTEAFDERNPTDGMIYRTQYFERARFEYHPENQAPYDVLLGLLGMAQFSAKYGQGGLPAGIPARTSCDESQLPPHTRCINEQFGEYYLGHGGLAQQGYAISDAFDELSSADGKTYLVQYFERGRLEYHPEYAGTPSVILLGLLGGEQLQSTYPQGLPWGPTLAPLADGLTFTAADGRFSVRVPRGWAAEEVFDARNVGLDPAEKDTYCSVRVFDATPGMTLATAAAADEKVIESDIQHNKAALLSTEQVLVQGVPAYRYTLTEDRDGTMLQESRIVYVVGGYYVRSGCTSPVATYATWLPTFDGVVGSVSLRGVAQP